MLRRLVASARSPSPALPLSPKRRSRQSTTPDQQSQYTQVESDDEDHHARLPLLEATVSTFESTTNHNNHHALEEERQEEAQDHVREEPRRQDSQEEEPTKALPPILCTPPRGRTGPKSSRKSLGGRFVSSSSSNPQFSFDDSQPKKRGNWFTDTKKNVRRSLSIGQRPPKGGDGAFPTTPLAAPSPSSRYETTTTTTTAIPPKMPLVDKLPTAFQEEPEVDADSVASSLTSHNDLDHLPPEFDPWYVVPTSQVENIKQQRDPWYDAVASQSAAAEVVVPQQEPTAEVVVPPPQPAKEEEISAQLQQPQEEEEEEDNNVPQPDNPLVWRSSSGESSWNMPAPLQSSTQAEESNVVDSTKDDSNSETIVDINSPTTSQPDLPQQEEPAIGSTSSGESSCLQVPTQRQSLTMVYASSSKESTVDLRIEPEEMKNTVVARRVSFASHATIHYHTLLLGEAPSVSCGAPLALGRPVESGSMDISTEDKEPVSTSTTTRNPETPHGNTPHVHRLWMPPDVRTQLLIAAGVRAPDIERAVRFHNLLRQHDQLCLRGVQQHEQLWGDRVETERRVVDTQEEEEENSLPSSSPFSRRHLSLLSHHLL